MFAVALLLVLGFAPGAFAATLKHLATAKPGVPGRKATHNKLDRELTFRAGRNPNVTTSVIVTLRNGAKLPAEFKKRLSAVPWLQIAGLRNRIVHDHAGIDLKLVWNILQ